MISPFFMYISIIVHRDVIGKQGVHPVSPENSLTPFPYRIIVLILFIEPFPHLLLSSPSLLLCPLGNNFANSGCHGVSPSVVVAPFKAQKL